MLGRPARVVVLPFAVVFCAVVVSGCASTEAPPPSKPAPAQAPAAEPARPEASRETPAPSPVVERAAPPAVEKPAPPAANGRAELATDGFVVDYPAGLEADARKVADFTWDAVAALTDFTGLSWRDVVADGAVRVRLSAADENRMRAGAVEVRSKFTGIALAAEIELLAPSAHPANRSDGLGAPFDDAYFRRVLTRQTGVLFAQRLRRLRPGGFSYDAAPRWFQQGIAEWFGVELGAPEPDATWEMFRKRAGVVEATPAGVRVESDVLDGALLVRYLAATFGRNRLRGLLLAPETEFYDALAASCGVTPQELVSRYRP
jgi:hypothetical protein